MVRYMLRCCLVRRQARRHFDESFHRSLHIFAMSKWLWVRLSSTQVAEHGTASACRVVLKVLPGTNSRQMHTSVEASRMGGRIASGTSDRGRMECMRMGLHGSRR